MPSDAKNGSTAHATQIYGVAEAADGGGHLLKKQLRTKRRANFSRPPIFGGIRYVAANKLTRSGTSRRPAGSPRIFAGQQG